MAQQPTQPMSTGIKVLIGMGAGCGCLLVGLFVLGILAAIILPSFLGKANKTKQSEGKQYTGTLMRSQQAYFLENKRFARSPTELSVSLPSEATSNYRYQIQPLPGKRPAVVIRAIPKIASKQGFLGIVVAREETTETLLCQSNSTDSTQPSLTSTSPAVKLPTSPTEALQCPTGMLAPAAP